MDTGFVITWKELLIGGIIVLAIYIAELLLLTRSGHARNPFRRGESDELGRLRARVTELEKRLSTLEGSPAADEMGGATAGPAPTPYAKAFSMAAEGSDVAQVAAKCGISRAEAELIVAMQRSSTA